MEQDQRLWATEWSQKSLPGQGDDMPLSVSHPYLSNAYLVEAVVMQSVGWIWPGDDDSAYSIGREGFRIALKPY